MSETEEKGFQDIWPVNSRIVAEALELLSRRGFVARSSPAFMATDRTKKIPGYSMLSVQGDSTLPDKILRGWYFSPKQLNVQEKPIFQGRLDELILIGQKEIAISNKGDRKPVIGTYGLSSCVAVLGYELDRGIGFVGHFDAMTDIKEIRPSLLYHLSQAGELPQRYEVHLIGGQTREDSRLAESIVQALKVRGDIKFEVVEEDLSGGESSIRSIGVDTRTGQLCSFGNEHFKVHSPDYTHSISLLARLVYKPKK